MTTYQTWIVSQGDTPQSIAAAATGDASRWREITALNKLRWPYISDKPVDQYGPPLTTGVLADDINDGDLVVTIPGENPDLLTHGAILFLDGHDDDGHYVYSATRIDGYDEDTGDVALLDPVNQGWSLGGRYRVCPPPEELDTAVARTGDTIALPLVASGTTSAVIQGGELIDLFGADIAVTDDGLLTLEGGDLKVFSGLRNAQQGLVFRARLPQGQSLWHPSEGNLAYVLIGGPQVRQNIDAAALYTRAAIATDPRIQAIPDVTGQPDGPTAVRVDASVQLIGTNRLVRFNAILREQP